MLAPRGKSNHPVKDKGPKGISEMTHCVVLLKHKKHFLKNKFPIVKAWRFYNTINMNY